MNKPLRDEKGHFLPGNGGKPKGAISQKKRAAAEAIKKIVEGRSGRLLDIVDKLDDNTFLRTWLELIEYVEPKLSRTDVTSGGEPIKNDTTIIFKDGA